MAPNLRAVVAQARRSIGSRRQCSSLPDSKELVESTKSDPTFCRKTWFAYGLVAYFVRDLFVIDRLGKTYVRDDFSLPRHLMQIVTGDYSEWYNDI